MLFNFKIEAIFLPPPPESPSQAQSVHALSTNAWANLDKRSKSRTQHKPAAVIKAGHSARQQAKVVPISVVDVEGRLLVPRQSMGTERKAATDLIPAGAGEVAVTISALISPPASGGRLDNLSIPPKPIPERSVANTEPFVSPVSASGSKDEPVIQSTSSKVEEKLAKQPSDVFTSTHEARSEFHTHT